MNKRKGITVDWIPVEERLPEDHSDKIVTVSDLTGDYHCWIASYGADGWWHGLSISDEDVTAWCEIPSGLDDYKLQPLLGDIACWNKEGK